MRYLWLIPILLLTVALMSSAQTKPTTDFTVDRLFDEIVGPLERENLQLRFQIMGLNDRIQLLEHELVEAKKLAK